VIDCHYRTNVPLEVLGMPKANKRFKKTRAVKRLLLVLVISLTFNLIFGLSSIFKATATGNPANNFATLIVQKGDTLWTIARQYRSGDDPRALVHEIKKLNQLSESSIYPGQALKIPLKY